MNRYALYLLPLACLLLAPRVGAAEPAGQAIHFETHVRPILKAHCFECHGEGKRLRGGFDARLKHTIAEGGDNGPGLSAGKPGESRIVQRLRAGEMPPGKKKLAKHDIDVIERWIAAGAPTARPEPASLPVGFSISPGEAAHWAFQPIRRPDGPRVKDQSLVRTPVDAFLLAGLEAKGLSFSGAADPATLLRRVYFDLTGLPPTPAEVAMFLRECADAKPQAADVALARVVDHLLASPHYGERWGRHWLDVAGYADSEGYADDRIRTTAWRYRDYVIRAFNADMPMDRFIQEQLAGDEMVRPPYEKLPPGELDKLIATGFLRMAPDGTGSPGADVRALSNQTIADTIQIVSSSLVGLTLHCAQCHNHRYDPIPQIDYYKLRAVFEPALDWKKWRAPAARETPIFADGPRAKAQAIEEEAVKIDQARLKKQTEFIEATFQKQLAKLPKELHEPIRAAWSAPAAQRTPAQAKLLQSHPSTNVTPGSLYLYDSKAAAVLKTFADDAAKLRATKPTPEYIRALTEAPGPLAATHFFERGDHEQPRQAVAPGHLTILESFKLPDIAVKNAGLPSSGRRLDFARSLTSGRHPLTARVLMNRVWLNHFGKGIVGTPGDFGILGERPTHPELLDWLASEFMAGGWRLKAIHKTIVLSTAYRQASARRPELEKLDPENRLLGRMPLRRLEAEAIRDAMLAVSGKLNPLAFGPPVPVTVDEVGQAVVGRDNRRSDGVPDGKIKDLGGEEHRRSVYIQVRRSLPLAMLEAFDAPLVTPNCEVRHASTVAPQALMLMNSRFIHEQAGFVAERVRRDAGADVKAQVALAWKLAYGAEAPPSEVERGAAFVTQQGAAFAGQKMSDPALAALTNYCQALLSSNRFLYVD
jgi:mono/diheme cytochrome c family protein